MTWYSGARLNSSALTEPICKSENEIAIKKIPERTRIKLVIFFEILIGKKFIVD